MKRVAFLGPTGTVSHEATAWFFAGESYELVPYKLISDVFMATVNGETQMSAVPIENTIEGSVRPHVDWLVNETDLPILAEWTYPSIQYLIGHADEWTRPDGSVDFSSIRRIISKDVAIAQCWQFLRPNLPDAEYDYVSSTAEGVRTVKEHPGEGFAAVGTRKAAEMYGLKPLTGNITDHQNNYTRFILIGNEKPELKPALAEKTTIVVTLPEDYPGALHQVLSAFAWRRINMSKIESRPTKLKLGNYYFYIDIEGTIDSVLLPAAIEEIEALGCQVRILGSYPIYPYETTNAEV